MFKQLIEVKTSDPGALVAHVNDYDKSSAVGLQDVSIYRDRNRENIYFIEAVFASREEAEKNNAREETDSWARSLRDVVDDDPFYCDLDPVGALVASNKGE